MTAKLGQGPEAILEGRMRIAAGFIVLVFAIFGARLFQWQIIEAELLETRARHNATREVRIDAPRGRILDREGRILATTRPAFGLQVIPSDLRRRERTFAALSHLVDRDTTWFEERVSAVRRGHRYRTLSLIDDLTPAQLARVAEHRHVLPGVLTDAQPRRHYPDASLAAHLLGTIGEISSEQVGSSRWAGYKSGEVIGKGGLEARLERHLHGRNGGRQVMVDVAGREVELLEEVAPVPGGTAVLALDLDLQRAAWEGFQEVLKDEPARVGAAVALDVRTGDVLAMLSQPDFDPNDFAGGVDVATWKALTGDAWKPLQNRAIQNHYPPGSTYKAIVAAALLEEGIIDPGTRVFCPGHYRYGKRNYRCWRRQGHGWVGLRDALKRSCDVFFYQYGVKLGIDRLARYARAFSLGGRTGIDLPAEATGLVPDAAWKKRRFSQVWFPGETVSASIGQGYNLTTPLQIAVAYAAIANGGTVYEPRLVLRLESHDGRSKQHFAPRERARLPVSPEALSLVRDGLTAVVMERGGTGGRSRVEGVRVAGKTGTSQVVNLGHVEGLEEDEIPIRHRDHAWFAAFAPAEAPEIAAAVFVEHGRHGSSAAAPIVQRILARYFEKKRARPAPGETEEPDDVPRVARVGGTPGPAPGQGPAAPGGHRAGD